MEVFEPSPAEADWPSLVALASPERFAAFAAVALIGIAASVVAAAATAVAAVVVAVAEAVVAFVAAVAIEAVAAVVVAVVVVAGGANRQTRVNALMHRIKATHHTEQHLLKPQASTQYQKFRC